MSLIQEALLLRENKQELVRALQDVGFSEVNYQMPLSELAEYMKWSGGLRDLSVACVKIADGSHVYFTEAEWSDPNFTSADKAQYRPVGVRIRAERQEFVIAPSDCGGGATYSWGPTNANVAGLTWYNNLEANAGLFDEWDAKRNTDLILAQAAASGVSYPAAEAARAYKVETRDNYEWSLPTVAQLKMMYKYRTQLQTFMTSYLGVSNTNLQQNFWSCNESHTTNAWSVNVANGYINHYSKANPYRVRAVSAV